MAPSWSVVTAACGLQGSMMWVVSWALCCATYQSPLPPQVQPDGVTLKYNDYAWNKVWALLQAGSGSCPTQAVGNHGSELLCAAPPSSSLQSRDEVLIATLGWATHKWCHR